MARPRGKLFALLAIFAAIGLVTASGAFTSVTAERTVTVDIAGDSAALLGLSPNSTANGAYASNTTDGELTLQFTDANLDSAAGLNPNATTFFGSVFDVQNNGNQEIDVTITDSDNWITLYKANSTATSLEGTPETLGTGEKFAVGVEIDTSTFSNDTTETATITIQANATAG